MCNGIGSEHCSVVYFLLLNFECYFLNQFL